MRVTLIRHAEAGDDAPRDEARTLTLRGRADARRVGRALAERGVQFSMMVSSPLVRAVQTAEILARIARWPQALEASQLAPGLSVASALTLVGEQGSSGLVLVGHEPGLSRLVALAIGGPGSRAAIVLKKGGAACLGFEQAVRPGGAQLLWLATPKLLRALGRASKS